MKMLPRNLEGGGKTKSACFSCRYTLKKRHIKCNKCGGPMHDVGPKFRTPPVRDKKQWAILKTWLLDQRVFRQCGIYVPFGPKADTPRQQKEWFTENRQYVFSHKIGKPRQYNKFPYVTFK